MSADSVPSSNTNIFWSKLYTLIYCRHFRTYSQCAMFDWSDTVFRGRNVTRRRISNTVLQPRYWGREADSPEVCRLRSSSVFGCSVNWPDWNVTIIFRFFQRCLTRQPKRCFNADGKYVLRLLNVVIHEHQLKRKGIYRKFHFDKEAYTKTKNIRIFTF
jgi:hypothetical protein